MENTLEINGEEVNPYSCSSHYIECCVNYQDDIVISKATCFFYRGHENDQLFLITNWHVVTGKNPLTGEYLNSKAAMPTYIKVKLLQAEQIDGRQQIIEGDWVINLYSGEKPLWRELKNEQGIFIDVIALPCTPRSNYLIYPINELEEPFNEQTKVNVAEDVFVIGFPFGKTVGNVFPIWKRASVASEMAIDIDDLPRFYVDTATREGMSGSPVVKYEKRGTSIMASKEGKYSGYYTKFVGVYSGRIIRSANEGDNLNDAQLGIVWKVKVIDDLISILSSGKELKEQASGKCEIRINNCKESNGKFKKVNPYAIALDLDE